MQSIQNQFIIKILFSLIIPKNQLFYYTYIYKKNTSKNSVGDDRWSNIEPKIKPLSLITISVSQAKYTDNNNGCKCV